MARGLLSWTLALLVAVVLGHVRRVRRLDTLRVAEEHGRRQVLEERARIARELHDVVAHHMSVIAVQAASAPYRVEGGVSEEVAREFAAINAAARESLRDMRHLLGAQPDLQVVGEAADGVEAVAAARELRPDVVLVDVRMPNLDGLEATRRIAETRHGTKVLILTTFDIDDYVYAALRGGASGFLLKDAPPGDLITAVRVVAGGDALLAPSVTRRLIEEFACRRPADEREALRLNVLTARELDVLRLLASGLANAEIAGRLTIAEETVKSHVGRIFAKLGLRDRAQAVVLAYESGLVVAGSHPPGAKRGPGLRS
ncbi:response regulator [Nonomuraea diastatica]|uniref:Response regulator n=2 Tax=Nonomuraea diastatica TaxID=1848329 RepID=A0A4R4X2W7_9ACTN|nr:response regulator [Nonomuraea diastatica]TDD24515.1 response regulator [Nonomuraea diastatica]